MTKMTWEEFRKWFANQVNNYAQKTQRELVNEYKPGRRTSPYKVDTKASRATALSEILPASDGRHMNLIVIKKYQNGTGLLDLIKRPPSFVMLMNTPEPLSSSPVNRATIGSMPRRNFFHSLDLQEKAIVHHGQRSITDA